MQDKLLRLFRRHRNNNNNNNNSVQASKTLILTILQALEYRIEVEIQ